MYNELYKKDVRIDDITGAKYFKGLVGYIRWAVKTADPLYYNLSEGYENEFNGTYFHP